MNEPKKHIDEEDVERIVREKMKEEEQQKPKPKERPWSSDESYEGKRIRLDEVPRDD